MLSVTYALLWLVVLVQGLLLVVAIRELSSLRSRVEGSTSDTLLVGRALDLPAADLVSGERVPSRDLNGARRVLLFLSADCRLCAQLVAEIASVGTEALAGLQVYCVGERNACRKHAASLAGAVPTRVADNRADVDALRLTGFPAVLTIDEHAKVIATHYPSSAKEVLEYLAQSSGAEGVVENSQRSRIGQRAVAAEQ